MVKLITEAVIAIIVVGAVVYFGSKKLGSK